MSKSLEDIRKKIDTLDDKIHDLLMDRADLVVDISKAKKNQSEQIVQPAREARMIRRLLQRHRGPLPEATIVRIWRELVGAVSLLQTGLKVSVSTGEGHNKYWDMAKNYFGSVLPMEKVKSGLIAVSNVREHDSDFAVVPWPHDGEANAWWPFLINQEGDHSMRIICAFPYGYDKDDPPNGDDKALVVSRIHFQPSGNDHSFLGVDVDNSVSRGRLVDVMKGLGLEPLSVYTKSGSESGGKSQHLIEVNDYIGQDDKRLKTILDTFKDNDIFCFVVGGYPVQPEYSVSSRKKIDMPSAPEKSNIDIPSRPENLAKQDQKQKDEDAI